MMNRAKHVALGLTLSVFIASLSSASQSVRSYEDIRRLLAERPIVDGETLSLLFSIGDERIQDLIRALDDSNNVVRRNAQVVIRYLGNDTGMKALIESYNKSSVILIAGPVPLPLRDWDYKYVRKYYISQPMQWGQDSDSFIYALALDRTPEATALLSELSAKVEKGSIQYSYAIDRVKSIQASELPRNETDLAKLVIDHAFFISPDLRENASGRLMGFNHAKDKALIEVNAGAIPLGEESYHVVLQKRGEGWKFFSVKRVKVS